MKRIIMGMIILLSNAGFCSEFQWTRVKIGLEEEVPDKWNAGIEYDQEFLEALEKMSTVKVNKKINMTTFEDLDNICKFPMVFMMAEGDIKFSKIEIQNMREYCQRGGFIFADDCVYQGKDLFFQSFKKLVEEKIFPGKKMEKLKNDHPIYHCLFDFNDGLPWMQGNECGGYGISNDKGRVMIFLSPTDIHCGWSSKLIVAAPAFLNPEKRERALKMGINIVVYALTH